ncbi:MAG: hypothetical protein Kow00105_02450 [Phycisphaeraceae bacterium]
MLTLSARLPAAALITLGSIAALSWGGLPVSAQTRAGSDGRALDANQQVGSGGINPADGQLDFSRQNDIVTGNVGGGRAFQHTIDYGAVGEFRDNLGSDTLFDFRARSLPSSPGYFNAATLGGVGQGNISVYRSFTNRVAQPQAPGLIAPSGGVYSLQPDVGITSIYRSRVDTEFGSTRFGERRGTGLALQAFSAAPSLGLDRQPQPTSDELSQQLYDQARDAGTYQPPQDLGDSMRYDTNLFDPFSRSSLEQQREQLTQPGQLPPTMLIGQQLQMLFDPGVTTPGAVDPTRSRAVLDSVFKRMDRAGTPGDSAYSQLLKSIRERKESSEPDTWEAGKLESPTDQQLTEAEKAYDAIMKELYGEDYESRLKSRLAGTGDESESEREAASQVKDVVGQLNYDLPRLQSLASDRQTRIAETMREAEAALAEGRYLTAEARYRQLLRELKDDPMPRVGLIHAQLGAGMFRSAGMNLRALFVQHPELIAARYDARLLPPEDRLQWIQTELQNVISQGEGGPDAPLLLAYLGYQADSRQLVRYGLALAQAQSPRDPLLAVIREIWLDESETSSDGE